MLQEIVGNPSRFDACLRTNYVKLGRTEADLSRQIWNNGCFAIFHARRDLRHNDITREEWCVAFLDFGISAQFRTDEASAFRLHRPHRDKRDFYAIVEDA